MGAEDRGAAYSSATCNCIAFILLLFTCSSPYMLSGTYVQRSGSTVTTTSVGVGPFIAGQISTSVRNIYSPTYFYSTNWVWWSQVPGEKPCSDPSSDIFKNWANVYGFCGSNSTTYSQGPYVSSNQAMIVLATIFSFFATTTGYSAVTVGSQMGHTAALMTTLAAIFAIAAFSLWVTWPYSKALRSEQGAMIPLWSGQDSNQELYPAGPVNMWWGSGWIATLISAIILTISAFTFCGISRRLDEDKGQFGEGLMP